jgi:hypothetical protein
MLVHAGTSHWRHGAQSLRHARSRAQKSTNHVESSRDDLPKPELGRTRNSGTARGCGRQGAGGLAVLGTFIVPSTSTSATSMGAYRRSSARCPSPSRNLRLSPAALRRAKEAGQQSKTAGGQKTLLAMCEALCAMKQKTFGVCVVVVLVTPGVPARSKPRMGLAQPLNGHLKPPLHRASPPQPAVCRGWHTGAKWAPKREGLRRGWLPPSPGELSAQGAAPTPRNSRPPPTHSPGQGPYDDVLRLLTLAHLRC